MLKKQLHIAFFLAILIPSISVFNFNDSWAKANASNPPLPPYRIEIAAPHLSKYFTKVKKTYVVKVNAISICDKPMRNLMVVVALYKQGHPFDHIVMAPIVKHYASVNANKRLRIEETLASCVNFKSTFYVGVTYGQAVVNGKNLELGVVKSKISEPLACGT